MADRGRGQASRSRSPSKGGEKLSKGEKKKARDKRKADARKVLELQDTSSSEEQQIVPSAEPVDLATDNAVLTADFVNSLANSINGLTSSVRDISLGMKSLQKESREQKKTISDILGEVQGMQRSIAANNQKHQDDIESLNKEIEDKLAKIKASSGQPPRPASFAAAASAGAASSAGPAPAASPGKPAPGGRRPTRLWIKGFRETLTTKYLNEYARSAIDRISPNLRAGARTGAPGFGTAVYIDYPADTLMIPIKAALIDLDLRHRDEAGEEHRLRVTTDQPLAIRHKGRVLGELWKQVEEHLSELPADTRPRNFKLGNSNGRLFLVLNHRPTELFATATDDLGNLSVVPNRDNLMKYKIDEALAQSWAASAARLAARAGQ